MCVRFRQEVQEVLREVNVDVEERIYRVTYYVTRTLLSVMVGMATIVALGVTATTAGIVAKLLRDLFMVGWNLP
jgi:hypothetical protein